MTSSKRLICWGLTLVGLLAAGSGGLRPCDQQRRTVVLNSPVNENTAVRFFYQPVPSDVFHFPLVFRPVGEADPRLNTAPMREEGRTAYISFAEMRALLDKLAQADLTWQESEKVEALGSYKTIEDRNDMEVFVTCSKGTARALIAPKAICKSLTPLDDALKTPRALWELQIFRLNYNCKVPGFPYDAYPDHI